MWFIKKNIACIISQLKCWFIDKWNLRNSLFRKLNGTIHSDSTIQFTIAKNTYRYSVTLSIVTIIEIRLMKSVVAQAHIFSSNLRIVCIVRFGDQNFLDDTVQGYYANQLKLTVFLPAISRSIIMGSAISVR